MGFCGCPVGRPVSESDIFVPTLSHIYIYIHYKLGQFSCKSIKLEVGKIQHKQGNYTKTEKGIDNDLVIVSSLDEKLAHIYFYG